jgi:hypothetical protein
MRFWMLLAGVLWLPAPAAAEDAPRLTAFDAPILDRPTELPPLLAVPPAAPPPSSGAAGPMGEYEPGYFYLPERSPDGPRKAAACGPDGRLWIGPGLELAWIRPAAGPFRRDRSVNAGLSLTTGSWLNEPRTLGWDASGFFVQESGSGPRPGSDFETSFVTADVNVRRNWLCNTDARLDSLVGYRFGHLADEYATYRTRTHFHGGQIGLTGELRRDRWFVSGTGTVALGVAFREAESRFAVMPVAGVSVGRQLWEHVRIAVGYQLFYLNHSTGIASEIGEVATGDFWAQSVRLTAEWRY